MQLIENQEFSGERPLFALKDAVLRRVVIHTGESSLKHTANVRAEYCRFEGKYPFWHADGFEIDHCTFTPGGRAALWYSRRLLMTDTVVDAPKMFRDMEDLRLLRVKLTDAAETFWNCRNVTLSDVQLEKGDYLFMHSSDITIDNYHHQGNYAFQYCRNVIISNAVIHAKDAFWNSENVTVINSEINGEYLGWHSKNLRLINCRISGTQPFCYCDDLMLENCTMASDCDLAFEYSSVDANLVGPVTSIKNPTTGVIRCDSVGEVILDDHIHAPANCRILTNH